MTNPGFFSPFLASTKFVFSILVLISILSGFSIYIHHIMDRTQILIQQQYQKRQEENIVDNLAVILGQMRFTYMMVLEKDVGAFEKRLDSSIVFFETEVEKIRSFAPAEADLLHSYTKKIHGNLLDAAAAYRSDDHPTMEKNLHETSQSILGISKTIQELLEKIKAETSPIKQDLFSLMDVLSISPLWALFASIAAILASLAVIIMDILLPMRTVTQRMIKASLDPENPEKHIVENARRDEAGMAERALNHLLSEVAQKISQIRQIDALSRERLAAIEATEDGIGIVDKDGNFTYINRALLELHGLTEKDLPRYLGHSAEALYSDKGKKQIRENVMPSLHNQGFWRGESPIVRADGGIVYADMSLTKLQNGGYIGTARNITTRRQIEEEKKKLQEQFVQSQKMEAVGRLTGGVAHDFNNMLTVISGNLDIIDDYVAHIPQALKHTAAAKNALTRGAELTQRLLAFSRRQVLQPKTVDINVVVQGMLPLIKRAVGENVEISTQLASNAEFIKIDVGQFENALLNLAINARDAMPQGGNLTIKTADAFFDKNVTDPYVLVVVQDTGEGIPPEIIDRVFEPFFTTKEVGKGSGLGLSTVYGFAKQSNGHATIESKTGEGTTVSLFFPKTSEAESLKKKKIAKETQALLHLPIGTETILIVEDDPDILNLGKEHLSKLGYTVHSAANGAEAVLALDRIEKLDLLLTDIVMPGGISGGELAREMKSLFPSVKVIFASGYDSERALADSGLPKNDFLFMAKPYTREQMALKIREILGAA